MDNGASSYRRFLDGDDSGIASVVSEYKDGLILYLSGYVNNVHTAEDLAEETFFRLMVKRPDFSGKSSFKSFLYAIGRNVAVDHIRRSSKTVGTSVEDMEEYLADESDVEKSYIKEEKKLLLRKAIKKLPVDQRQAVWLVYFEGMASREAGAVLKKSPRQMKNLLYRAKQDLRYELEKEGFTDEDF